MMTLGVFWYSSFLLFLVFFISWQESTPSVKGGISEEIMPYLRLFTEDYILVFIISQKLWEKDSFDRTDGEVSWLPC